MDSSTGQEFKIILGSSSVARKKILADMGFEFTTMSADIDEKAIRKEKPEDLVMALAEAKIHFHDIPEQIIDNLIEEGNVLNVAGGLIIEHPLVLPYVKEVVGGTDSVMGLPKELTRRLMKEVL
ncbi:UNVERIFIED_CONTAM: 7-methyl-GTP pyrophosphatase [Sesamum latifolium]|uniref:7-methyl-GTP pyrophosphatase n=1 Tax=Sesamum latifolium TaxID=2727402 RepID=A0AAW2VSD8_9LAMI